MVVAAVAHRRRAGALGREELADALVDGGGGRAGEEVWLDVRQSARGELTRAAHGGKRLGSAQGRRGGGVFVGTRQSGGSSRGSGRVGTRGGSRRCRERGKGPSGRTRGWERATRREGRRHRGAPRAPTRRRRRRRRVSARGWTTHARTRFRGVGHRECVSRVRPKSLRPERGRGWRHPRDAHAASASTRERTRARAERVREVGPTRRSTRRVAIDKRNLQPSASGRSIW